MPGTITFKPIEATLTGKDQDLVGKMDPYCLFHVGHHKFKSQVCKSGGNHPVWNDEITIDMGSQPMCTVEIKDKDMFIDDKLGTFEVDLREIESQGRVRKWYPIFHKNQATGEILLESFYSGGGSFNQPGLSKQGLSQNIPQQNLNQGLYQQGMPQQNFPQQSLNQGGFQQGLSQQSFPQQGFNQGFYQGSNLGGSNLGHPLQTNLAPLGGGFSTSQVDSTQNFAEQALLRGVDPTNISEKLVYNQNQGLPGQNIGGSLGQNLAQPELIYEGDVNRFNKPPHQMPFGHGHHTPQDPLNPLNPTQNLSGNKPNQF